MVVVRGRKTVHLASPVSALEFRTIMPTYHVSANGLSYRKGVEGEMSRASDLSGKFGEALEPATQGVSIVELEEGEMLFIPTGWVRQIKSSGGQNIALNYMWRPPDWQNAAQEESEALGRLNAKVPQERVHRNSASEEL